MNCTLRDRQLYARLNGVRFVRKYCFRRFHNAYYPSNMQKSPVNQYIETDEIQIAQRNPGISDSNR